MIVEIGTKFGEWTILALSDRKRKAYLCRCSCGKEKIVDYQHLRRGKSVKCLSCSIKKTHTRHGDTGTRLYHIWCTIKQRHTREAYKDIYICKNWNRYESFKYWAINNGYDETLSIDRINGKYGYCPFNCRWTTKQIQAENTKLLSKHNTSGYRGVSWNKCSKKYSATIKVCNKHVFIGYYKEAREAALAYDKYVLDNNLIYRPLNLLERT